MSEAPAAVQDHTAPTMGGSEVPASGPAPTMESTQAAETPALASDKGAAEAVPNVTNVPKEENTGKSETLIESQPINEGVLNYKGPGLKGLIFSKKYFWFSDSPLEPKHLAAYIGNEKAKDIAHGNAAHATQTGKGLLFFTKRAEDKHHPQGILNLADMVDIAKGSVNDFTAILHGHKYTFQAQTKSERDGWIVALESRMAHAKTSREGIVGSEGYKSQIEKYGKPTAVAGTSGISRSLSRPTKASKSRERVKEAVTTKESTPTKDVNATTTREVTPPATSTTPGTTTDSTATSAPTESHKGPTGDHIAESAAGATVGAAAVGAAARKGSTSDEDKKTKKTEKSRSQSRNKRGSIFGGLLAKKEESDEKKAAKKAEKEEKKEEKAEEKAVQHEIKKEEKAEQKAEKEIEKEAKHEDTGKTAGFDAAAIASRVVGEPVLPATGTTTAASETTPAAAVEPAAATGAAAASTTPPGTTSSKPNKRSSVFGTFFGKRDTTTPAAATEASPPVPAKDEPAAVAATAPQLEDPVASPVAETTAPTTATKTEAAPVTEAAAPTSATTPTDKRRTSFFGNLGNKKERKTGATSGDELTDGEAKKQSGGFGGLLRKASRAQPKKDSNTPVTDPAEVPLPKETPVTEKAVTNGEPNATAMAEHKPDIADGEVGSNAIAKHEQSTAVEATA